MLAIVLGSYMLNRYSRKQKKRVWARCAVCDTTPRGRGEPGGSGWGECVRSSRYSHISGTQLHEYDKCIPPGEPHIRQAHVHIQGACIHKTG